MKNFFFPALFISLIFIATSCETPRYIYSPSAHNVPVLTKKGDSKIGAVYSTNLTGEEKRDGEPIDNRTRGFDLHGAVAITDNFAIQANHFYRWEKTTGGPDTMTIRYKRNLTELGLGYYLPVNDKRTVFFQFFAGAGLGKFSFTDKDKFGSNFHEANITKVYLQPAMLFRSKGSFTSSVSVRASIINYSNIKTSYNATRLDEHNLDHLNSRGKVFFEPAFTGSFGLKGLAALRFEFQGGLSFLAARTYVDYRFVNFSAGTWLDIGSLFNKNTQ
ncbi:MAG TPA: hypothetical protein VK489_06510 [Ferruginibacter sp.]|nr:hypothetical protein [Ferruginibacter sp.]